MKNIQNKIWEWQNHQDHSVLIRICYSFVNFDIRHSGCNYKRLPKHLLKQIQRIIRLLWQKDCWGTAEVNDPFKILSQQLYCWWHFSQNSNAVFIGISFMLKFKVLVREKRYLGYLLCVVWKQLACVDSKQHACFTVFPPGHKQLSVSCET